MAQLEKMWRKNQLAAEEGISLSTIDRAIKARDIEVVHYGRIVVIPDSQRARLRAALAKKSAA
jgi:hypothetical protein